MGDPAHAWALSEPEPTTLIALWPGAVPRPADILDTFASQLGEPIEHVQDVATGDPSVLWSHLVALPGRANPAMIWAEQARPLPPDELDDARASACRWVLGIETVLEGDDPFNDFCTLMLGLAEPGDDIPAVLDLNTSRWHPRESLDRTFAGGIEPPASSLWVTHVVHDGEVAWIHTHGLRRCGLPEIEMLGVPKRYHDPGAALVETIAGRLLEAAPPAPGHPFPVGPDMQVALQPWQVAASHVGGAPGGPRDRAGADDQHAGVAAVVCGEAPRGGHWCWPEGVLDHILNGRGALYVSDRETRRQQALARSGWGALVHAFEALRGPGTQVSIKAGLPGPGGREHLWFDVRRFEGDRAEARLLNPPISVQTVKRGDVVWIDRQAVSDWSVAIGAGSYGPGDLDALQKALP